MNELTVESLALKPTVSNTSSEIPEIKKEEKCEQMKVIAGIELAGETIDEIKEAFLEFDIDSDGTITTQVLPSQEMLNLFSLPCHLLVILYFCKYLGAWDRDEKARGQSH